MASRPELTDLLDALSDRLDQVQRHLWLIRAVDWIRGRANAVPASHARLTLMLDALQQRPKARAQLQRAWQETLQTVDATALLADYGFASRSAFVSELAERLRLKLLPGTPETTDAATLFALIFSHPFDARWIAALDSTLLQRLVDLFRPAEPAQPDALTPLPTQWQASLMEAVNFCASQIRATGFLPELRLRMSPTAREAGPFHALGTQQEALASAWLQSPQLPSADCQRALRNFHNQLEDCRHAAATVYTHLEAYGISVNLVFQLRQLRDRVLRIRALLDCLFSSTPHQHTAQLIAHLITVGHQRLSISALISANSSMLAAKVAERSSGRKPVARI